jgi:predicted nucleic acid-binding protein
MSAKAKVYVETTVVSYLTARKTRDAIAVAHQAVTRRWWRRRKRFDLYCSQIVVSEAGDGDAQAAQRRLAALKGVPSLETSDAVKRLAAALVKAAALPKKATEDALHIALATVHGMDYLLTWNCKHIANAEIRNVVAAVAYDHGYGVPVICTPEELMGE